MRAGLARTFWLSIALVAPLASLAPGCKNGDAEPDPGAMQAQQELFERRDALVAARQNLQTERDKIDAEIKQGKGAGSDTAELEKKRDALDAQLSGKTDELISVLGSKVAEIKAVGDKALDTVGRERAIADRERAAAERERAAAEREQRASDREHLAAEREVAADGRAQQCTASAAPVIMQVQAPKGTNYNKTDIAPLLQRARNSIAKKGLLPGDLGAVAGLEAESTRAMADGDWGKAYLAANTLAQTVDTIKVDHDFIRAKVVRFNTAWAAHKQDSALAKQVQDGTSEVTRSYSDGNFAAANARLNALFGQLR